MTKLHRVIVAVDFSEPARAAFDKALALTRLHDAELTAVHAVPTNQPFKWGAKDRIRLMGSLAAAAHAAGVRFKSSVQHGDPAGVIVLHAGARRADLIVIGTNEQSGFDRFRLGSVAEAVVREATQPVLVVPADRGGADAPVAPFRNILVAVDFNEDSMAAVERALSMANGDSRVTVVHVVQGAGLEHGHRYAYHLMEPEYQRSLARRAWHRMAALVPAGAAGSRRVHTRVVNGEPTAEIARVAAEVDADLILVGVTPRGRVGRWITGSTAARVIRTARRPVLAIPRTTRSDAAGATGLPAAA